MFHKRKFKLFLFAVSLSFFIFFFPTKAFAAITFSISTSQQSISQTDELSITVTITGLTSCATCYLQAAFTSATGNPSYLGYTQQNGGSWYQYITSPSPETIQSSFFSFQPSVGSWTGVLKAKVDTQDSDYVGTGQYIVKVMRYTGNSSSGSWSDDSLAVTVNDNTPSPTFTPAPTNTPAPTSTPTKPPPPTPTSKPAATSTPKPASTATPALTAKATPTHTPTPTPTPTKTEAKITTTSAVLAKKIGKPSKTPIPTLTNKNAAVLGTSTNIFPQLLIGAGVLCFASCGILGFRIYKKGKVIHEL